MAKIITENFRVSNTKEFIDSFSKKNQLASDGVEDEVESYLIRQGILYNESDGSLSQATELSETQRKAIRSLAKLTLDSVRPENDYYVFASTADREETRIANTQFEKREFLRKVIFGKKIDDSDIRYMFKKRPWVANRIYFAFDDRVDSENEDLYVTVGAGTGESSIKVFKCLSNNNNNPSTVEPSISLLNTDYETQTLADGYVWKYMFEVPPSQYQTYQTTTELPYSPDANVTDNAKESISSIKIEKTPAFLFQDLNLGECLVLSLTDLTPEDPTISVKTYRVEVFVKNQEKQIKKEKDSYKNMYMRVVDPTGYRTTIFDIVSSEEVPGADNRIYVYIQTELKDGSHPNMNRVENKDVFISPKVQISKSSGVNAIAYGILNSAGTISNIGFINSGTNYKYATAKVIMPNSISERADETSLRVITSPIGGHGSDPVTELFMSRAVVVTNFFSTDAERIPESNGYTKVGLVKNPKFASAENVFPRVFDNRLYFEVATDVVDVLQAGTTIEQNLDGEMHYAVIHEVTFDDVAGVTKAYAVDYTGDWSSRIGNGRISVKSTRESEVVVRSLDINNVKINQTEKTLANGLPSGDFEDNEYVAYSGEVLHFIDFEKIIRDPNRKEKVKLVFDF